MASYVRVGTFRAAALIAATIVAWLAGGAFALASSGCEAVQGGRLSLKDGVVEFAAVDGFAVGDKVHYQIKAGPRDGSGGLVAVLPGGATSNIASVNGFGAVHGTYTVQNPLDSIIASASGSGSMTVQCTPAPLKLKSQPSSIHQVGQPYSQTNAGSGGTQPYKYSFDGRLPAGTKLEDSGTVSGTPTTAGEFSYTIKITDGSSPPQTATNVMSGMIAPPTLTITSTASSTTQQGQPYSQTNEAKGGTPPYTYSVSAGPLPAGTTLDTKTGTVSGTPSAAGTFSYTIKVKDSGSPKQTATTNPPVNGTITPPTLKMISTPSATTQVGQSYSQTNVASGGTPPYTFSVSAGAVPTGTKLDDSGTVSGTPTTAGAFSYTVQLKDNLGQTVPPYTASGMIAPPTPPKLTISCTPSLITQMGQLYSQANVASGGTPPYKYSYDGTLPAGTKLDDSTGVVSGIPTAQGPSNYTIKVTDGGSSPQQQTASCPPITGTITVRMPLTLTSTPSAVTQAGQPYSQTNEAKGGTPPYTYEIDGTPPVGTTFDPKTGTVSGTPTTAGAFSYTIKVMDGGSPTFTASNPVSGTIAAPPMLTLVSMASPMFQVGQSFSQANVGSGGIPPYSYSVSAGALPVGTKLDDKNGTVSGTPTTAGAYSYTIQVKDAGNPTLVATNPVSGPIAPAPLTITSVASSIAEVGQSYSQTNVGGGGTSPYMYWVSAGELPAGTTLNPLTGTVAGRPTTPGPFSYKIKMADSCGWWQTTSAVVTGTIAPATLTVTAMPSPTIRVGQPYSQLNVASGGTAPYKYSVADGTPPAGTTLDDSTGKVSGTPTAAVAFRYTIRATDSGKPMQTATTKPVSGMIEQANLNIISMPSATTQVGQSYSQTNVANGGTAPYTYSVASDGTLPAGTTLNTSTGTVSGTASTAGAFSYIILARDSGNPVQTVPTKPPVSGTIMPATQCCTLPQSSPRGCWPAPRSKHRSAPCLEHRVRRERLSHTIKMTDSGLRRSAAR